MKISSLTSGLIKGLLTGLAAFTVSAHGLSRAHAQSQHRPNLLPGVVAGSSAQLTPVMGVDFGQVERELAGDGAVGWIHGAVAGRDLFTFTYRKTFFEYAIFPMLPETPTVAAALARVSRHDRVRIFGRYAENSSPQRHIIVTRVEVVEPWTNPYTPEPYQYEAQVPRDLLGQTSARFLVHAIAEGGRILVVEYRDQILPIFVRNPALTSQLSRNDVVEIQYRVRARPEQPVHLVIQEGLPNAIRVIQAVSTLNGRPVENIEGELVLFAASPEIRFDVFALNDREFPEARRQFTLVNFENPEIFRAIREKLKAAWDRHPRAFVNGRNKLVSTCIAVRARGVFHQIDANQANVQILLASADDLDVLDRCQP